MPQEELEKKPWFVETDREANNAFGKDKNFPIASPIFSLEKYKLQIEDETLFKDNFLFYQKIRGDGACYFNACLAGILNKCVNNPERWGRFKQNLIDNDCKKFANKICQEGGAPSRQRVNDLLQARGDENIVRQLSEKLLIPQHEVFIKNAIEEIKKQGSRFEQLDTDTKNYLEQLYPKFIRNELTNSQQETLSNDAKRYLNFLKLLYQKQQAINLYGRYPNDLSSFYYESDLEKIIETLSDGLNLKFQPLTADNFLQTAAGASIDFKDPQTVFLWNGDGVTHFDLLYNSTDEELNNDIVISRSLKQETSSTELTDEESEKVNLYLSDLGEEDKEFKDSLKEMFRSEEHSELDKRFIFEIIKSYESSKNLDNKEALEAKRKEINTNTSQHSLAEEDRKSFGEFATNECLRIIGSKGEVPEDFVQLAKLSLAFDNRTGFENRGLIMEAALHGKPEFITFLKDTGENFAKKDPYFDNTPLIWAIANANNQFAYDLIELGKADQNVALEVDHMSQPGTTALHLAAAKGYLTMDSGGKKVGKTNSELVQKLIEIGADPNITTSDSEGFTALDIAVARRNYEMVESICDSEIININTLKNSLLILNKTYDRSSALVRKLTGGNGAFLEIDKNVFDNEEEKNKIKKIITNKIEDILRTHEEFYSQNVLSSEEEVSDSHAWFFNFNPKEITPEKEPPQTKITVISVEPVVSNRQSVWLKDDRRGNKFRVIDGVYENEGGDNNYYQTDIGRTFIGILQKIAKGEKGEKGEKDLTTEQFLAIIDYAKKNGGVTNKYNASSQKYSDNEISELKGVDAQRAKRFSARFQEECRKCGIYTGREGANVKMVGLRLTFIPDDVVDVLKNLESEGSKCIDFSSKVKEIQDLVNKKNITQKAQTLKS